MDRSTKLLCTSCGAENVGTIVRRFLEEPGDVYDKGDVMALAMSIARGDAAEATRDLDRLFRDDPEIAEWIAQGRALA